MAVIHTDFKHLLGIYLEESARHHPDDSGMGYNQYPAHLLAVVLFDTAIKEGRYSLIQILKTLSFGRHEVVNPTASFFKFQGQGLTDFVK